MARKKPPEKAPNHERWLVSYADFITLLFAVFVTLYAMSQTDKKKVDEVAASYRSAFGITVGSPPGKVEVIRRVDVLSIPSDNREEQSSLKNRATDRAVESAAQIKGYKGLVAVLEKLLNENGKLQESMEMRVTKRGLVISLKEAGVFAPGSAEINEASYPLLSRIADALRPYDNRVSFEGHTDNRPAGTGKYQSNWELSVARATAVAQYFIDRQELVPDKMSVSGFGQYHPVANNATEEGRRRNRRVEIVVLGYLGNGGGGELP